jgi:mRNA-degrading endonuclease toxin of MazEF toxin-antitoxin module
VGDAAKPARWDVVWVDFGVPVGHEQGKARPALVVSHDGFNAVTGLMTVCPITGARTAPKYPSEVAIPALPGILQNAGVVLAQQIRTVSQARLQMIAGPMKDPVLQRQVSDALRALLPY